MRKIILPAIIVFTLACSLASLAYAVPSTLHLSSGYDVTSNYQGIDVPFGSPVTVTAATTNQTIENVTFLWHNPGGGVVWTDVVPTYTNGSKYGGELIRWANSTHAPDIIGDWGVQALFQGDDGKTKEGINCVVATRSASFNVVPEIPVIGSVGALLAMLGGFALKRKNKITK